MHMQIKGWTQFRSLVRWSVVFHHVEGLWFYLLLKYGAMLKDGVPCEGIMLNSGQYVRFIYLLRKDLWSYNLKKRDLYSHSQIQSSIMLLKKLSLITAELFSHDFLFPVPGVGKYENNRKLAEMEEASAAEVQPKTDQNLFFRP
ncbi:hypothetical protein B14911_09647 [Bacillus sp. NRRL B-14911]|uniref:Uncharacterized protein n=1 Tax=Bacillus infantis NRRL B-14911 TaxID=1367477 RepID=U5L9B0_9BACI|nr:MULTISPECIES: hypothetical protein [Bacillus]AGX04000.1 hypothetical protein N288_10425 [Bacillus infantis NRRL B-14911]EAR65828.1 hypothetical protein B14911_09647 [Bacillus sp. NRRL B-14911]